MSVGLVRALSDLDAVLPAVDAAIEHATAQERQGALLDLYHATPPSLHDALWAAVVTRLARIPRVAAVPAAPGVH